VCRPSCFAYVARHIRLRALVPAQVDARRDDPATAALTTAATATATSGRVCGSASRASCTCCGAEGSPQEMDELRSLSGGKNAHSSDSLPAAKPRLWRIRALSPGTRCAWGVPSVPAQVAALRDLRRLAPSAWSACERRTGRGESSRPRTVVRHAVALRHAGGVRFRGDGLGALFANCAA
jgi:hypothetical protein